MATSSRRIKLAFLSPYPPSAVLPPALVRRGRRSGAHPAPWIAALCPALARTEQFEIRVYIVDRGVLRHSVVEKDQVVYDCIPFPFPERFNLYHRYMLQSWLLARHIRAFAPDWVHAFGLETACGTMALRTRIPCSCFIQGIVELYRPFCMQSDRELRILSDMERSAVSRINWMVAENEFARSWILGHNPGAHVQIVPHPVRPEFLSSARSAFGRQIISIGCLDNRKGMDTIIAALARMKSCDVRLCLVGRGPNETLLRRQAADLGVAGRVDFKGALECNAVVQQLQQSSVFAVGSRMDTSPNVVTEAHAVGLPVVGTRAGGIPEMIDDGRDGFLVGVDDVQAMADRLDWLMSRPDEARGMGEAGREKVRVLNDPASVAAAHADFFRRVVDAGDKARSET